MGLKKSFAFLLPSTLLAMVLFLSVPAVRAETNLTGRDLAQQVFDRDRGFNSKADAIMVLSAKMGTNEHSHSKISEWSRTIWKPSL